MKQTRYSRKSEAQNLCSKCPPFTRTHAFKRLCQCAKFAGQHTWGSAVPLRHAISDYYGAFTLHASRSRGLHNSSFFRRMCRRVAEYWLPPAHNHGQIASRWPAARDTRRLPDRWRGRLSAASTCRSAYKYIYDDPAPGRGVMSTHSFFVVNSTEGARKSSVLSLDFRRWLDWAPTLRRPE